MLSNAVFRYQEELFPTLDFRKSYDQLREHLPDEQADKEYLKILELAGTTMECEIEGILKELLAKSQLPMFERVRCSHTSELPLSEQMPPYEVDLEQYNALLVQIKLEKDS